MDNKLKLITINPTLQKDIKEILNKVNNELEDLNNNYITNFTYEEFEYINDYINKLLKELYTEINSKIKEYNEIKLSLNPDYLEEFNNKIDLLKIDLSNKDIFSKNELLEHISKIEMNDNINEVLSCFNEVENNLFISKINRLDKENNNSELLNYTIYSKLTILIATYISKNKNIKEIKEFLSSNNYYSLIIKEILINKIEELANINFNIYDIKSKIRNILENNNIVNSIIELSKLYDNIYSKTTPTIIRNLKEEINKLTKVTKKINTIPNYKLVDYINNKIEEYNEDKIYDFKDNIYVCSYYSSKEELSYGLFKMSNERKFSFLILESYYECKFDGILNYSNLYFTLKINNIDSLTTKNLQQKIFTKNKNIKVINCININSILDELNEMGVILIKDSDNYILCEKNLRAVLLYLNYKKVMNTLKEDKNNLENDIKTLQDKFTKLEALKKTIPYFDEILASFNEEEKYYNIDNIYLVKYHQYKNINDKISYAYKSMDKLSENFVNKDFYGIFIKDKYNCYTDIDNEYIKFYLNDSEDYVYYNESSIYPNKPISIYEYFSWIQRDLPKNRILSRIELRSILMKFKDERDIRTDIVLDYEYLVNNNKKTLLDECIDILKENNLWDNKLDKPLSRKKEKK